MLESKAARDARATSVTLVDALLAERTADSRCGGSHAAQYRRAL
jgi:hypothetical protein